MWVVAPGWSGGWQAQLEELELMEKEEQAAAQVQGKGDCGSLGGGLASYYYDPSSSLAELNRLYNVSHHLPPTTCRRMDC